LTSGLAGELPTATETLYGRDDELAALDGLLGAHRVVTVLGAGGIGKTRLAQAAAHRFVVLHRSRATWVDLAPIADPVLLPATLAQSLGLPIAQRGDVMRGLLAALRPVTALVVLDNAEYLVEAVAQLVRAAVDAAPGLRVLVTSQAPLQIDGERMLRLEGLEVPAPDAPPELAARAGAVALFVERARAVERHFELTEGNVAAVARLCGRLDGLPLAIRLAAARAPLLGLVGLEGRLHERLQLLAGASRDAPSRHQTLLGALQWSVGLLSPEDQALFRRLAVFIGGFTLDLAVAACYGEGFDEWAVIDGLGRLVDRSLVSVQPSDPPRYRLLEGPRAYALRLLGEDADELRTARQRHARAIADALFTAWEALWTTPDEEWLPRWAPELDNVRAALDWSAEHDAALFVSQVRSVPDLFRLLGLGSEIRHKVATLDADALESLGAELLVGYWCQRSYLHAEVLHASAFDFALRAERHARVFGCPRYVYLALCVRLTSTYESTSESQALLAEIAELESTEWPARLRAYGRLAASIAHNVAARYVQALQAAESGFALSIGAGAMNLAAILGSIIVTALLDQGDVDAALQRSKEIRPQLASSPAASMILFDGSCARASLACGDLDTAKRQLARMFETCRAVEWANFEQFANLYLRLAFEENRVNAAARLLGFADATTVRTFDAARSARAREKVRALLAARMGLPCLAQLTAEGKQLDPESVCALVLGGPSVPEVVFPRGYSEGRHLNHSASEQGHALQCQSGHEEIAAVTET
jgi:predicted ATPase